MSLFPQHASLFLHKVSFPINLWAAEESELNKAQINAIIYGVAIIDVNWQFNSALAFF